MQHQIPLLFDHLSTICPSPVLTSLGTCPAGFPLSLGVTLTSWALSLLTDFLLSSFSLSVTMKGS